MKPILLLLAALALPATLCGQGTVVFLNTSGTAFTTNDFGAMRGVNAYRIGLYTAPDGTTSPSLFTLVGVATNSALLAGRFVYGSGNFDIPGNTGQAIAYQVRAWSLFAGSSFEEAFFRGVVLPPNGPVYIGESGIGRITPTASSLAPAPALFGLGPGFPPDFAGQLNTGIQLIPILPEPSTYALAVLAVWIFFCCRKKRAR